VRQLPAQNVSRRADARRVRLLALTLCVAVACSCASRLELDNALDTPEALARALLDALAENDRASLERLTLSEDEFRGLVWPELPAARPERNLPADYVWTDLHQKSRAALGRLLVRHGGRRYQLESVTFRGESTVYATVQVKRESELFVRDAAGTVHSLRAFGSMVNRRGRYKVFSYVVD
jgi:hypothetical protein